MESLKHIKQYGVAQILMLLASMALVGCASKARTPIIANDCFSVNNDPEQSLIAQGEINFACTRIKELNPSCAIPVIPIQVVKRDPMSALSGETMTGQYISQSTGGPEARIELYDYGVTGAFTSLVKPTQDVITHEAQHAVQDLSNCYPVPYDQIGYPQQSYSTPSGSTVLAMTRPNLQGKVRAGQFCIQDKQGAVSCTDTTATIEIEADFIDSDSTADPNSSYSARDIVKSLQNNGYALEYSDVSTAWSNAIHSKNFWESLQEQLNMTAGTTVDLSSIFQTIANNPSLMEETPGGYVTYSDQATTGEFLVTKDSCSTPTQCTTTEVYRVTAPTYTMTKHLPNGTVTVSSGPLSCNTTTTDFRKYELPKPPVEITVTDVCAFKSDLKKNQ